VRLKRIANLFLIAIDVERWCELCANELGELHSPMPGLGRGIVLSKQESSEDPAENAPESFQTMVSNWINRLANTPSLISK